MRCEAGTVERKVFLSALIVPYPDDLYLSPRLRGNSIINLEITISARAVGVSECTCNPGNSPYLSPGVNFQHFDCRVSYIVSATESALTN